MLHTKAEILINQEIAPGHYKLVLNIPGISQQPKPGQFFLIKAGTGYDPLLRRPIAIHRICPKPDIIEMLYKVQGAGTSLMSRRSRGTYMDIVGPLGNGFKIPKTQKNFILIAGGMGIAPLMALADELAYFKKLKITVIIGVKTKTLITCKKELEDIGAHLVVITEDGSAGEKGYPTSYLEKEIEKFDIRKTSPVSSKDKLISSVTIADYQPEVCLYACGPVPMLKEVSRISKPYNIHTQVSLEEKMACGLGACLGCAVKTVSGYKMVCKDGPVFNIKDIVWE